MIKIITIFISLLLLLPSALSAKDDVPGELKTLKSQADSAFYEGKYDRSIDLYKQILNHGMSADIAYNLGNAYSHVDSTGKAILCYERALLLEPGMKNARENLDMAISNTKDHIDAGEEFFIVNLCKRFANMLSSNGWAVFGFVFFALLFVCIGCYFFFPNVLARRISFYCGVFVLTMCVISNLCSWYMYKHFQKCMTAVVMPSEVKVMDSSTDTSKDNFKLHEGAIVEISDSTDSWYQITLPDDRQGWLNKRDVERVCSGL